MHAFLDYEIDPVQFLRLGELLPVKAGIQLQFLSQMLNFY